MESDLIAIWRAKSDDDVLAAAAIHWEFTDEARAVIRGELRRRGLAADGPFGSGSIEDDLFEEKQGRRYRFLDVSRNAASFRWIRIGSGWCWFLGAVWLFSLSVFAAAALESMLRGRRLGADDMIAVAASGVASLVLFALGWGYSRFKPWAAVLSLAIGMPIAAAIVAILVVGWRDRGAAAFLLLLPMVCLWLIVPAWHLLRYRRSLGSAGDMDVVARPLQARAFHTWENWRGAAPYLLLMVAVPYGAVYLNVERIWAANPLVVALILCPLPFYLARRKLTVTAAGLLRYTSEPPILFLRSFDDDRSLSGSVLGAFKSVEQDMTMALAYHGPVVAIGRPGERLRPIGAAREYVSDDHWQARVSELIADARYVVLMAGMTEGLAWEVDRIVQLGALRKLVIVLPPGHPRERASRWIRTIASCRAFDGIAADMLTERTLMVRLDDDGEVIVATGQPGRTGDYFEAVRAILPAA